MISWTKYVTADQIVEWCDCGWIVSTYYGQRGPHETYIIVWAGKGEPVFPESYRRRA